jgi:hypothetical protein
MGLFSVLRCFLWTLQKQATLLTQRTTNLKLRSSGSVLKQHNNQLYRNLSVYTTNTYRLRVILTCKGRTQFQGSTWVPRFCRSSAESPCKIPDCSDSYHSSGGLAVRPACSCSCCCTGPGPGGTCFGSWSSWAALLLVPNLQGKRTTHSPCYNCHNTEIRDHISTNQCHVGTDLLEWENTTFLVLCATLYLRICSTLYWNSETHLEGVRNPNYYYKWVESLINVNVFVVVCHPVLLYVNVALNSTFVGSCLT